MPAKVKSVTPYDSNTFDSALSLRVEGNFLSTMSLAPNGRDAVLAGRKGLFVVDLDDPFAAPRWLHHETPWQVADVQWSPHRTKPTWIVSTSNQKAIIWDLRLPSHNAIEHVLHGHTRAITDINFHPHQPEVLATCSVDTFVLVWDMRTPDAPVHQMADWTASASQVKWNFKDSNIVASSHDSHILIWDIRKGAKPLQRIDAHSARINGIDWSRNSYSELVSCSNDETVKFWSVKADSPTEPFYTIKTDFPVARARHVPFGKNVCGIMPLRGGNNSVYIAKYGHESLVNPVTTELDPICTFKGHSQPVKDFLWRSRHHADTQVDDREFQLVTWSSDCDLRLWPIDAQMAYNMGHVMNRPLARPLVDFRYRSYRPEPKLISKDHAIIRRDREKYRRYYKSSKRRQGSGVAHDDRFNHLQWISGIRMGQAAFDNTEDDDSMGYQNTQPTNLAEEVAHVGHKFTNIHFERIAVMLGSLVVSLNGPWAEDDRDALIFVRLRIQFPRSYPSKTAFPSFSIEVTHDLTQAKSKEMEARLGEIAKTYLEAGKLCLVPCIRYLSGEDVPLDFVNYSLGEEDNATGLPLPLAATLSDQSSLTSRSEFSSDSESGELSSPGENANVVQDSDLAKDSTPLPKGCGAIWAPSGHLVYFTNKTEEESRVTITNLNFGGVFNGNFVSPFRGDADTSSSARSYSNSSRMLSRSRSSSGSSSWSLSGWTTDEDSLSVIPYDALLEHGMQYSVGSGNRENDVSISNNNNNNNHTYTIVSDKSQAGKIPNEVRFADFSDLMPAKLELAFGYRLMGDTSENLARYNALVAERFGYTDRAYCWQLLAVLLQSSFVPDLELVDEFAHSIDNQDIVMGCVEWGDHPFGGRWLVSEIFRYYEEQQDVQMLAVMSCVLHKHHAVAVAVGEEEVEDADEPSIISSRSQSTVLTMPLKEAPAASAAPLAPSLSLKVGRSDSAGSLAVRGSSKPITIDEGRAHSMDGLPLGSSSNSNLLGRSFERYMMRGDTWDSTGREDSRGSLKMTVIPEKSRGLDAFLDQEKLALYREQYASLLLIWGLPVNRIKVLKYNYCDAEDPSVPSGDFHDTLVNLKWMDTTQDKKILRQQQKQRALKRKYGLKGPATTAPVLPSNVELRQCQLCLGRVKGRVSVCTHCNHVMHAECALSWWKEGTTDECPSGCGCRCLTHSITGL